MDHQTVKKALLVLYSKHNIQPDGGINDSEVKIELFKGFSFYIPNFDARKKIVVKHDIHHLVTGYSAFMKGETEISAWELSTGCSQNWVAFTINMYGMMSGVLFNPMGIWRAWLRGRRSRNLYHEKYDTAELMNQKVATLKTELGLTDEDKPVHNIFLGFLSFSGFLIFGTLFSLISVILVPFAIVYTLAISIRKLWQKT